MFGHLVFLCGCINLGWSLPTLLFQAWCWGSWGSWRTSQVLRSTRFSYTHLSSIATVGLWAGQDLFLLILEVFRWSLSWRFSFFARIDPYIWHFFSVGWDNRGRGQLQIPLWRLHVSCIYHLKHRHNLLDPDIRCMLTPERSIQIQRSIGADIMMQVLHRESIFNACHERPTYICSWMMLLTLDMRTKTDLKKQDTGLWGGWTGEHSLWVFENGVGCWSEPALFHKVSLCPPSTWPPKPVSHSAGRAGGG